MKTHQNENKSSLAQSTNIAHHKNKNEHSINVELKIKLELKKIFVPNAVVLFTGAKIRIIKLTYFFDYIFECKHTEKQNAQQLLTN